MNKNLKQIFEHPLMVILISILTVLLILSLQENKRKAQSSSQNLQENQEHIALFKKTVMEKEAFYEQTKSDLYKERLRRNELVKNKKGETVILIPEANFDEINYNQESTPEKIDYRVQNWKSWWQLLTIN